MSASSRADSFPGTRSSAARKVISPSTLPQPPGTLHGSGRNDRLRSVGSYVYATASTARPVTAACRRQKAMASTGSTVIAVPAPVVVPAAVPDAGPSIFRSAPSGWAVPASATTRRSGSTGTDSLVLYLPGAAAQQRLVARMAAAGAQPTTPHPYWQANGGVTYHDPDGR